MISAFVSRSFGIGIILLDEELMKVNEQRRSEKWGHYMESKAAIEIYGSTKKKEVKDRLTLVRFFDLRINQEGYWNYFHMALQIEDVYDVLSIKFPAYDFLLMLDQSSGHGRMRQGSLNEKNMSVKWGGQQDKFRDTIIEELGPYRSILAI